MAHKEFKIDFSSAYTTYADLLEKDIELLISMMLIHFPPTIEVISKHDDSIFTDKIYLEYSTMTDSKIAELVTKEFKILSSIGYLCLVTPSSISSKFVKIYKRFFQIYLNNNITQLSKKLNVQLYEHFL